MAKGEPGCGRSEFKPVSEVLDQLHKSGIVNLDKSMREMLSGREALGRLSPGGEAATAVIAWDGYGIIIKSDILNVADLANVAERLRGASGPAERS